MSDKVFEINCKSKLSKARTGQLKLANGLVQTPVFMPIGTIGSVKTLTSWDLYRLNSQIILGNTYHLWLKPGMQTLAKVKSEKNLGKLHQFIGWQKPMLTDSGGFQAWSLSKIRTFSEEGVLFSSHLNGEKRMLTPEKSIQIQTVLGSDIVLVLDQVVNALSDRETAQEAMQRTYRWAKRCKQEFDRLKNEGVSIDPVFLDSPFLPELKPNKQGKIDDYQLQKRERSVQNNQTNFAEKINLSHQKNRLLFGIPQGAQFQDLRIESAKLTMELDFEGYSVGGVAQGGEPAEVMYQQVLSQTEILEEEKPKHLLGVGTPNDIIEMVKRGIDMFDCVYPTRNARHGSLFVWLDKEKLAYETIKIESKRFATDFSPIKKSSNLEELQTYTKAYLHHLFRSKEALGQRLAVLNNLEFYFDLMTEIRIKIEKGEF